jgi:hypothetical protein
MHDDIIFLVYIQFAHRCTVYVGLAQARPNNDSRKYWRELNLAVEPKIAIAKILAVLNLAVQYGIAIRIYTSRTFCIWRILIWRV